MASGASYVDVVFPGPFLHAFTYIVPAEIPREALFKGQRVLAEFRKRDLLGFVERLLPGLPENKRPITYKPLTALIDQCPVLPPSLLELTDWAIAYYFAPPGEVYRALFPTYASKKRLALAPEHIADCLVHDVNVTFLKTLTPAQREIEELLQKTLSERRFAPFLLHGVTGSGKTEIYLHLIHEVVKQGGQTLFLLPEIGLTPQLSERVRRVFGDHVAVYHSGLTDKQRYTIWRDVYSGFRKIVVGTRSSLFLPFQDLRLIIVDEEHEPAYKQEEGFRYHARDTALVRGRIVNALVLLGTATPSLESLWNSERKKFHCFKLKERPERRTLPQLRIVDLKRFRDTKGRIPLISEPLRVAIATHLAKKQQVLLFLNRRGYATLLVCSGCGDSLKCRNCSVSMTFHQKSQKCLCHYCHLEIPLPSACPSCDSPALVKLGSGTERLEGIVSALFPKARLLRVDRDALQSRAALETFHNRMQSRDVDILLGTQLLAKGHDYPHITLVGIVNADLDLNFPDFRAEERSFQSLMQVSGRAGRAHAEGEVFIQTMNPEHPVFHYLKRGESEAFWQAQLAERRRFGYPPWTAFVQIEVSGKKEAEVRRHALDMAQALGQQLKKEGGISLLGPCPAPIHLLKGQYRWQLIVRGSERKALKHFLRQHFHLFDPAPRRVRVSVDVDPYSLM